MTAVQTRIGTLPLLLFLLPALALAQDGGGGKPPQPDKPAEPPAPAPTPPQGGAPPSKDAIEKGSPTVPPQGMAREQMWPAADADGWKKPVLIQFQRTWEDAVAVSKETGRQILVCINMDGEIASEHYAGVRYRQPEIAKLYEPYVCVIASTYRHNPRDYDDEGRRIICPRFGSVTCGEHIWIEPILFEKFMEGQRVAPRHICVDLNGKETYDVFYANDTASVFKAIQDGVPADQPPPVVRGDRPITERVASRDRADRDAVESAYLAADAAARRALLDAALANPETAPLDLLRLAVFGLDADAAKQARKALTQSKDPAAVEVIAESLRVPMDDAERQSLIAALAKLGETSQRAQWLSSVHAGLAGRTAALDTQGWAAAGGTYEPAPATKEWNALDAERVRIAEAAKAHPEDPEAKAQLAETYFAMAMDMRRNPPADVKAARFLREALFQDARTAALRAEALGKPTWRTNTVLALAEYYGGRPENSYARAEAAVKELPAGESSWNTMAVLTVFAESRWKAIQKRVRAKEKWDPQLLTDLNAANMVLLRHPSGTDAQAVWHYDFLVWLSANDQSMRFVKEAVARFPDSKSLHERFRRRLLAERGMDALEPAYAELLSKEEAPAALAWYAAIASRITGDFKRRTGQRQEALEAYDRAAARFEKAIAADPARREAGDRAMALLMGGRARLHFDLGDDDRALTEVIAALERCPSAAGFRDGGGMTPGEVAQAIHARLKEKKRDADLAKLEAALAKIDPELLRFDRPPEVSETE